MSKEKDRIYLLAQKVEDNIISKTELDEFNAWYNSFDDQSVDLGEEDKELKERIFASMLRRRRLDSKPLQVLVAKLPLIGVAASLLIVFSWFFLNYSPKTSSRANKVLAIENDATPGIDRAVLTLSNGRELNLEKIRPGLIAVECNFEVFKSKDNNITYKRLNKADRGSLSSLAYNMITVPKGGKYRAVLPDGSHIWLNASSRLRFPLNFGITERRVEMWGEGYYEVAKDRKKVFRVATPAQVVEVLGTHFNVKAYADEPLCKVTLLEGSVRIISGGKNSKFLRPGQQAEISTKSHNIGVQDLDPAPVVAWKSGYFEFDHTDFKSLMGQLSRWYNVDIVYQGAISNDYYEGRISRNVNLSEVLKILENEGISFRIEGKKLIVLTNNN